MDFLEKTAVMFEFKNKIMIYHSKSKLLNYRIHFIVVKIQISNQHRLSSIEHRYMLYEEYWEHVKVEMQNALK